MTAAAVSINFYHHPKNNNLISILIINEMTMKCIGTLVLLKIFSSYIVKIVNTSHGPLTFAPLSNKTSATRICPY